MMPMKNNGLSNMDKEIIVAFAKYDMRAFRAAKHIFVSKGTIVYHAEKIKKKTGLDMRKFYDLCKLLEMVK